MPRLSEWQETDEKRRIPGTREGVNGMLDYGYAILRTAVLRSLAAHGFIAAIGIAHAAKAGSFALADDVMEPLRPWIDRELRQFVQGGKRPMQEWMRQAVSVLQLEVPINRNKMRLLNAIDVYVQSFADAAMTRMPRAVKNSDAAVSDEPNNLPDEEELLPDERPRRSKYDETETIFKRMESVHFLPVYHFNTVRLISMVLLLVISQLTKQQPLRFPTQILTVYLQGMLLYFLT